LTARTAIERDLIRTRTAEGKSRAKAQGKLLGEAIRRRAQGATLQELARSYNVQPRDDFTPDGLIDYVYSAGSNSRSASVNISSAIRPCSSQSIFAAGLAEQGDGGRQGGLATTRFMPA